MHVLGGQHIILRPTLMTKLSSCEHSSRSGESHVGQAGVLIL